MLINAIDPEESRIAVVEDGVLQELHVELANREAYLGNIYKGKVVNIEPSIGAAFVAFGGRTNGFLHVSDVLPAYGRPDFRLEDVIEGRARVDLEDGPESMQQALSDDEDDDTSVSDAAAKGVSADDGSADDGSAAADAKVGPRKKSRRSAKARPVAIDGPASPDVSGGDEESGAAVGESAEAGEGRCSDADQQQDQEPQVEQCSEQRDPEHDVAEQHDAESSDGEDAPTIEPVDDIEVVHDSSDDDEEDDHGGGFGHGLDDERPMAMAAADPGEDSDPDRDAASPPSVETVGPDTADGVAESGGIVAGGDADDRRVGADETSDDDREGDGARRRKRPRSRRSRKPADRRDRGSAEAGDEPRDSGAAREADASSAEAQDAGGAAGRGGRSGGESSDHGEGKSRRRRGGQKAGGGAKDANRSNGDRRVPRANRPTIDQLLKRGQEVVVQITKEGIGTKGPTLTTYVSLPGRCLVLMPSLPKCGVSRKIEDGRERRRLKRIVKELDETGSGGIGFIVRTAGINKSLEDVQRDRDYLNKIWEMVAQRLKVTKAPALLYQESDLVLKAMRDQFTPDIADVVVDSEDVFLRIRDFADKLMPVMAGRIKRHSVTTPLFHSFGIEKDVEELYEPQVDLSNGASIVIDQAEALVAIDVNSGKYKAGGHGSDETAYRTNLESITEIVRQLRLRDLGGLIIIDFIDMSMEKHRRNVERKMIDALRGDRARIKVGRISPFGMMEITRQRVGPGLKRTVFMQCPHCKGAGWSRTVQSKALSVLREARALVNLKGYSMLQVFVAPAVADYLVNYKRRAVLEVEDAVGKTIVFRPEQSYPIDMVHYRFLTGDGQEARIAIPAGLGVKI